MTGPAKNFAVTKGIIIGVSVNMVSLPCSHSCTAPGTPRQFFSTPFTLPAVYSPASLYNTIGECHITPPYNCRDNDYSTKLTNVKTLSNRRWWGRIEVWSGSLVWVFLSGYLGWGLG